MTSMPSPRTDTDNVDLSALERVPPHDVAAEQAILGSMMISADAIAQVTETLQPRDYYKPVHETVHQTITNLYVKGEPVDPITVADELTEHGELAKVGGNGYLMSLVQAVPTAAHAEYYADIVRKHAVLRRLAACGMRITQAAQAAEDDLDNIRNFAEQQVHDAVRDHESQVQGQEAREIVPDFWDVMDERSAQDGSLTGLSTGLADLDSLTQGLQPGQLTLVAARPSTGKSVLALNLARAAAIASGTPTVFFSLEMGSMEIMERLYSAESRVGFHHIRTGSLTETDVARMVDRTPAIERAPLIIDDSHDLNLVEIRSRARRLRQQRGLGLIIVDYLQLMTAGSGRYANRQEEVTLVSRGLKLLAKELDVPVVALSQLNRGPEQRTDKMPVLADLRESGSLEQDADTVILLHREDVHDRCSPRAGEADLIVAKHRNGPVATITTAFAGHYQSFEDMGAI